MAERDKVIVLTNTTGTVKVQFMFAPSVKLTGKHILFKQLTFIQLRMVR